METFSSFIHFGHRFKKKMWWDYTAPNPADFLHFVLSQVLFSIFVTSIQAAPGSHPSHLPSSHILPNMIHLPRGPQPDTASSADQSVPPYSVFFFISALPYTSSFQLAFYQSLLVTMLGDGGGGVYKINWGIQQDPAFAWGTWNCTMADFGCSDLKIKINKKHKNATC